jgi:glycosyltransferase involved in cell wall biosynthesis
MKPLISIIIRCYNQAQYLGAALQSVYNQTYSNWECIIINDGSPDNTEEIAKS